MTPPVRIGLMTPLSGIVSLYGEEIVRAAQIACAQVNERGGVLGAPLELIVADDGSLPVNAVPAAQKLIEQHRCHALIGTLLSNSRLAVATHVADPARIPYLNYSFYEGGISSRYFFHFAALPNQQIDKMIPCMAARYGPKMFFAGSNYEWPRGSIDAGKRALQALGGDILGEEYLEIGVTLPQIDALLDRVARSGADVFVPYFAGDEQITLLRRFSEMGLKKRMAVVMGHYDEMMVSRLPAEVREGLYSSNTYFMSLDTAENQQVLQRLAAHPGVQGIWPAGNGILTNFGEGAYVCVHALANAAAQAGSVEAEALVRALEQVTVCAPQGTVAMDARLHHARVNTWLARCEADGSFRIIESFGQIAGRIPARYRQETSLSAEESLHASQRVALTEDPTPQATARFTAEIGQGLQHSEALHHLLDLADMAVIATRADGQILEANATACTWFGYAAGELRGLSVHLLVPPHFRSRHVELVRQFVEGGETERRMSTRGEVTGYRKDGSFFPLQASIAKFRDGETWQLVVTLRDISERKKTEEGLTRRATHDPLTDLPNRALIRERLSNALARSQRDGSNVALLFIDLDSFKLINDTHGHEVGDALLLTVADRLISQVRPGDTVARLAGDEFVVLCEHVQQPTAMSALAERINEALRQPITVHDTVLYITASIGITLGNGSVHSADDLLRHADAAMYAAKEKGRDSWQFFNQGLQEQAQQRLTIISGLRNAIEANEFSLRYQPIVAADSGRIVGAEMLLRWKPPSGEISPAVFIPLAEMSGSIVPIGTWVFRQACRAERDWRQRWGSAAPYISVNVSARQLNEESVVEAFTAALQEADADPRRILLEITESALMADVDNNLRILRQLTALGLRVAVDDFGTGYSSLSQLTLLPVNVLKIDRAFVDSLDRSAESRAVIRAVIGLGKALELELVAEGVEENAQRIELCAYGCDYIQGYLFYRPLVEEDLVRAVSQHLMSDAPSEPPRLHFLIYVSEATQPMSAADLQQLIEQSREANRKNGITGCLLYHENSFMQILEGREEALLQLMASIRQDPRHREVQTILSGPISKRNFSNWGMMLRDLKQELQNVEFDCAPRRSIRFQELAEDPRHCYAYITAHACAHSYPMRGS